MFGKSKLIFKLSEWRRITLKITLKMKRNKITCLIFAQNIKLQAKCKQYTEHRERALSFVIVKIKSVPNAFQVTPDEKA